MTRFLADKKQQHTIVDEMRQRQINHILLRSDLTAQWLHQLSDQDRERIAPLFAHSEQPLWNGQGHILLTVAQQKL